MLKTWTNNGAKGPAQSRSVPTKLLLVSKAMPAKELNRIRVALLGMATQGKFTRAALDSIGYYGIVALSLEVKAATIMWLGL